MELSLALKGADAVTDKLKKRLKKSAYKKALKPTQQDVVELVIKAVSEHYGISEALARKKVRVHTTLGNDTHFTLKIRGSRVSLGEFNPRRVYQGAYKTGKPRSVGHEVKIGGKSVHFRHTFNLREGRSIYERVGGNRLPIRKLMSPVLTTFLKQRSPLLREKIRQSFMTHLQTVIDEP